MGIIEAIKDAMQNNNSKKTIFALGLVVAVIVILVIITYFFYNTNSSNYDDNIDFAIPEVVQEPQNDIQANNQEIATPAPIAEANATDSADNAVSADNEAVVEPSLKSIAQDIENPPAISQLKYIIKPLDKNIASCNTMRNGRWSMPDSCKNDTLNAIKTLIGTNSEIIAIEVSGIVDNSPYSGPSAELKQEGLASFRAREAIGVITRAFSNVAVFEGLSIQAPNKRGFEVKAYYLQN